MTEREAQLVAALTEAINALRETRGPYADEDWVGYQVERAIEVGYELLSPPPPSHQPATRSEEDQRLDDLPIMVVQEPVSGIGDFDRLLDEYIQTDASPMLHQSTDELSPVTETIGEDQSTPESVAHDMSAPSVIDLYEDATTDGPPAPMSRPLQLKDTHSLPQHQIAHPHPVPVPVGLPLQEHQTVAIADEVNDGPCADPVIDDVDGESPSVSNGIHTHHHLSVAGSDGDVDVTIRPMVNEDIAAVVHLLELEHGEEPDDELIKLAVFDELAFVAESGEHVVGCVYARLEPLDVAEVINVLVASQWRRLGIGATLMTTVDQAAYFAGADAVTLYHSRMQLATEYEQPHSLYLRLGYVPVMLTENTTFFVKRVASPQR